MDAATFKEMRAQKRAVVEYHPISRDVIIMLVIVFTIILDAAVAGIILSFKSGTLADTAICAVIGILLLGAACFQALHLRRQS